MSNKIGRIVEKIRKTKNASLYKVETLTTDLLTVVDTLTCAAISTTPVAGDLVVLVEVQGKLFITGSGGGDMNTLGQVTSVADDGQLTVALYEEGSTNPLTETTHDRRASTQSVTAFQEAYGAADLKVNDWVKCYQLQDVWYVNNLDWTTAASEDLGAGVPVDFFIDNMDASPTDFDSVSAGWGDTSAFIVKDGGLVRAGGYGLTDRVDEALASSTGDRGVLAPYTQVGQPYTRSLSHRNLSITTVLTTTALPAASHDYNSASCGASITTPNGTEYKIFAGYYVRVQRATGDTYLLVGLLIAQEGVQVYLENHISYTPDNVFTGDITFDLTVSDGVVALQIGSIVLVTPSIAALVSSGPRQVSLLAYGSGYGLYNASVPAISPIKEFKAWVTDKGEPITNEMGHGSIVEGAIVWEDEYHDESGNYLL